jgi:hypothetical protein
MTNEMINQTSVRGWTSSNRNSNLELFRILTMLLIVAHHYVVNSGLTDLMYQDGLTVRSIFLFLFGAWGKVGINCFVLITGYFMCKSKITAHKFFKLLFEIEFYKIVIYFIFLATGYESFSLKGLVKAFLPIMSVSTGFTSCYILFYLVIPFLNILIRNMNEKQHVALLVLVAFIYVILGTIPKITVTFNYVTWFIVLYFIAAYLRMYPKKIFDSTKFWGWMSLLCFIVSCASIVVMMVIDQKFNTSGHAFYFVNDSNKILAVVDSICWFMFFKNIKIKNSKIINTIAASTFGVLLIHANSDTMRQWLWKDLLNNVGMFDSNLLYVHAIVSVLVIFIVCAAIDYLRILLIEKPFLKWWDKVWNKFANWATKGDTKTSTD